MTPDQRDAAMDRLAQLDREIDGLHWAEIDAELEDESAEAAEQRRERWELQRERDTLLKTFPEVKYWPAES